jgi:DnaJ-class molecular chaperone
LKTLHEALSGMDPFGQEVDEEDFTRGSNIEVPLKLSFEESVTGVEKELEVNVRLECKSCNGSGRVRKTQQTPFGMFSTEAACSSCKGQGKIITNPCTTCRGSGITKKQWNLSASTRGPSIWDFKYCSNISLKE